MSQDNVIDRAFIPASGASASPGERAEQRGGLNRETVVKLLIAWTVTPIFAGVVAAIAYAIISRF